MSTLALAGCSSGSAGTADPTPSAGQTPTESSSVVTTGPASPTASSTVPVPGGVTLTDQGKGLSFGDTATVIFEPTATRGSVLELTVRSVHQGSLKDFSGFVLDDAYKKQASYYYARVSVKNIGTGNVGGVPVPLRGLNTANTLLPPVNFTTRFAACPTKALPTKFGPGRSLTTCLVFLSPDHGTLSSVSYRPSPAFDAITWSGTITKTPSGKKTAPRDR